MTHRHITRRLILIGGGASVAALACGDDETTSSGSSGSNAGGGSASSSNVGGGSASSSNVGGGSASSSNVGGGGGSATACMGALLVKGSNYASDPHDLSVPLADLTAGVEKTYESTGNGHTHNVTLTAADFEALANGETVKKYSCLQNPNFADHEWVFSCADPNIMPTFEGEIGTPGNCPA